MTSVSVNRNQAKRLVTIEIDVLGFEEAVDHPEHRHSSKRRSGGSIILSANLEPGFNEYASEGTFAVHAKRTSQRPSALTEPEPLQSVKS